MENSVLLWSLGIVAALILLLAVCAIGYWLVASLSTRAWRSSHAQQPMPISDAKYAELKAELAELYSTLEKLTTTMRRLSSRQGMRDVRERQAESSDEDHGPETRFARKARMLKEVGMHGLSGPDFARAQMRKERDNG